MFERGTKLEINKDFNGIAEVCGLYPRGQSNYKENHQKIMINGLSLILPESLISVIFKEVAAYVQIQEEIVEQPEVKAVEAPKKVIKKLTKKAAF